MQTVSDTDRLAIASCVLAAALECDFEQLATMRESLQDGMELAKLIQLEDEYNLLQQLATVTGCSAPMCGRFDTAELTKYSESQLQHVLGLEGNPTLELLPPKLRYHPFMRVQPAATKDIHMAVPLRWALYAPCEIKQIMDSDTNTAVLCISLDDKAQELVAKVELELARSARDWQFFGTTIQSKTHLFCTLSPNAQITNRDNVPLCTAEIAHTLILPEKVWLLLRAVTFNVSYSYELVWQVEQICV